MRRLTRKPHPGKLAQSNAAYLAAMMPDGKLPVELQATLATIKVPRQRADSVNIDRVHAKRKGKTPETIVNDQIRDWQHTRSDLRLWRNSRGMVDLANGGKFSYGVGPNGASDWIGYRILVITPEMVGTVIAQFAALEAKPDGKNATPDQSAFIDVVISEGGIAGVAHSASEAQSILES